MKILVIEDEAAIRTNLMRMLELEGFDVLSADNGESGLALVRREMPDLIICDVMMPVMDGFGVLAHLRENDATATIPLLFLTALDGRESTRRAMGLGADDYLTKPFKRDELLQAITVRLTRLDAARRREALNQAQREAEIRAAIETELSASPTRLGQPLSAQTTETIQAAVLFSDIRGFTTMSEVLSATEVAELLNTYFRAVCEPLIACGGHAIKFSGDGVMAVFSGEIEKGGHYARRALQAALGMTLAAHRFRDWMSQRFGDRGLPEFALGVGVHCGEVVMCQVGTELRGEYTAIGDTVNLASRLEGKTKELGWSVIASLPVLHAAGDGIGFGRIETLWVRGRSTPVDVVEITDMSFDQSLGLFQSPDIAQTIREALKVNAEITARALRAAMAATQESASILRGVGDSDLHVNVIRGFRLVKKIGNGAMSEVFLARREQDGLIIALKLLNAQRINQNPEVLLRFIQEYQHIAEISHPNVVRIYDQAFTDDLAYIAMEHLPGGDLRRQIALKIKPPQCLNILSQVAMALQAIHQRDIIHRDLKPDNLMLRNDGSVVLVDFGISKSGKESFAKTMDGQVFGTPYYLSPEQASSGTVSTRSDFYSLGVLAFEMLMGRKPYEADSVEALMRQHLFGEIPRLPQSLVKYQILIDTLMAKDPAHRPEDAFEVQKLIELLR